MLFVCLSHFSEAYLRPNQMLTSVWWVYHVAMIATPTFMIVSGMTLGLLHRTHREDFRSIQVKLIDKGLVLLTVGRLLILVAHIPLAGGLPAVLRCGFVTDAIGVNVVVGSLLIPRLSRAGRMRLGAGAYLLGWAMVLFWHPHALGWSLMRTVLAGELDRFDPHELAYVFPLLPWFGVYLCSTCLGESLADEAALDERRAGRRFLRLGVASVALGVASKFGLLLFGGRGLASDSDLPWELLLEPGRKLPPAPAYLAFYGGAGLLLTGVLLLAQRWPPMDWFLRLTSRMGQTSLFLFILQYFVYFSFFPLAALSYRPFWPAYFFVSLLFVILVDLFWYRHGLNRLLTVRPVLSPEWLLPRPDRRAAPVPRS
jgi:Heparan-alpha-glucosaminide N-acetyltransferase, catalytic